MATNARVESFKTQASRLREFLKKVGVDLKHTNALEAVAQMHGYPNFHTLRGDTSPSTDSGGGVDIGQSLAISAHPPITLNK